MAEQKEIEMNYSPIFACYGLPKSFGETLTDLEKHIRDRFFVYTLVENINRSTSLDQEEKRKKLLELVENYKLDHYVLMLTHDGPILDEDFWELEKRVHLLLHAIFYPWEEITEYIDIQEETLIKWMTLLFDVPQVLDFLKMNETSLPQATEEEKIILREEPEAYIDADDHFDVNEAYFKVPWTSACNLVSEQSVLTLSATSWVPSSKMKRIIPTLFADHLRLEKDAQLYHYVVHRFFTQDQMNILCNLLYPVYCKNSEMSECEDLDFALDDINDYIQRFPPCFRRIQDTLNTKHHLKFEARRQYFMTFASLQPNPEELKEYMKSQFVTRGQLNEAAFHEHEYLIDHTFGEVGSRIVYRSPDCRLYINEHQGVAGDCSGCPFGGHGESGDKDLENLMTSWSIKPQDQAKVILHKRARKVSQACAAFFQSVHGVRPRQEIVNPVIYYNESVKAIRRDNLGLHREEPDEAIYQQLHQYSYEDDWSIEDAEQRWTIDYRLRKRYYEGAGSGVWWNRAVEQNLSDDSRDTGDFISQDSTSSDSSSDAEEIEDTLDAGNSKRLSSCNLADVFEGLPTSEAATLDVDGREAVAGPVISATSVVQDPTCSNMSPNPPKIRRIKTSPIIKETD